MAAVYRARDERLGRIVALKLLAAELTRDEGFRRRFLREARAIAAVDHPHIIPVYEASEADGVLFIAMRFVAGGDLRAVVEREGGLTPGRAAALVSPIASALDAAHALGLVHRDIKPANMLLDAGPGRPEHVYLSDFGLARGVISSSGLTKAGQFLGTPDYSAPEQISGRAVDGRADQYALACVAYNLLTGSVPFRRDQPMAALYAHMSEPPPRVTALRPDLPEAVDRVLAKALAKAPDSRYDSCGAFSDALRHALGIGPYGSAWLDHSLSGTSLAADGPGQRSVMTVQPASTRVMEPTMPADPLQATRVSPESEATLTTSLSAPPDSAAATPPVAMPSPPAAPPSRVEASFPVPDAGSMSAGPDRAGQAAATWTAVVTADRSYYDRVQADTTPDAALIEFPDHYPERRFRLAGTEARIGRRSESRRIEAEIDLKGPPSDPGVSHRHAKLIAAPDGTWSVVDLGTLNGTLVNGSEIARGVAVPLRDGDRINLGAWTLITMTVS
jgi:serine/threonine-protein kinase